jgi:gas vesicle protein
MAKKGNERLGVTVETLRPYIERALRDDEFRENVREAVDAARGVYGDLSKANGLTKSAAKLATDKDVHGNLQRALSELTDAVERVQKTKGGKRRKKRKMLLLAGVVAGALYNPWTGQSTRDWLLEKIGGENDLEPLDIEQPAADQAASSSADTNGAEPAVVGSSAADSSADD